MKNLIHVYLHTASSVIVKLCEGLWPALSLSDWIGGLFPLVAVESIISDCVGVAELEVEGAL